ncbi:hypothetical protein FKM82_007947 [Ascaphus truei]
MHSICSPCAFLTRRSECTASHLIFIGFFFFSIMSAFITDCKCVNKIRDVYSICATAEEKKKKKNPQYHFSGFGGNVTN